MPEATLHQLQPAHADAIGKLHALDIGVGARVGYGVCAPRRLGEAVVTLDLYRSAVAKAEPVALVAERELGVGQRDAAAKLQGVDVARIDDVDERVAAVAQVVEIVVAADIANQFVGIRAARQVVVARVTVKFVVARTTFELVVARRAYCRITVQFIVARTA